jgi:hypothetical protein
MRFDNWGSAPNPASFFLQRERSKDGIFALRAKIANLFATFSFKEKVAVFKGRSPWK